MYCKNCGAQLPDNAEFCSECGAKVEKPFYNYNEQDSYENFDTFNRTKEFNYNENGNRYYTEDIRNNNINSNKNNNKKTTVIVLSVVIIAAAAIVVALVLIFGLPKNESELTEENLYSAIKSEMSELNDVIETDEMSEAKEIETDIVSEDDNPKPEKIEPDTKDKPELEQDTESEDNRDQEESEVQTDKQSEAKEESSDKNIEKNTDDYGTAVVFDTDYVTMRSAGHMSASGKLKLYSGDKVTIKSIDENGYFKVEYNGKEGYVVPSYLSLNEDAVKKIKSEKTYTVITDYVTLRDIPSTSGEELDKIYTGAVLEYFSDAQDGFCLVRYNGRFGYVLKKYNGETLLR